MGDASNNNGGSNAADQSKQDRLAAALRENLKRRKAQGRARRALDAETTPGSETSPSDGGGDASRSDEPTDKA
ncbi:MAG: hypothetical protein AAFR28_09195 [Pseudomonadota bacterium]